jgi:hypothetical protein
MQPAPHSSEASAQAALALTVPASRAPAGYAGIRRYCSNSTPAATPAVQQQCHSRPTNHGPIEKRTRTTQYTHTPNSTPAHGELVAPKEDNHTKLSALRMNSATPLLPRNSNTAIAQQLERWARLEREGPCPLPCCTWYSSQPVQQYSSGASGAGATIASCTATGQVIQLYSYARGCADAPHLGPHGQAQRAALGDPTRALFARGTAPPAASRYHQLPAAASSCQQPRRR